MSDPGSVRYSLGGGLLTVANDLVVFVAPGGPVAEEWSELAQAPATAAELEQALAGELPADHHIAVVRLADNGEVMLCSPGAERKRLRVVRQSEGRVRFGMHPASVSALWVGSGVVGASGFEISGFALDETPAAPQAPPPPVGEPLVAMRPAPPSAEATPSDLTASDHTAFDQTVLDPAPIEPEPAAPIVPSPPPPSLDAAPLAFDPPVVATSLFPDVPIESEVPAQAQRPPVIERAATPPPPGMPAVVAPSARVGATALLRFDDGQEIPLDTTLAVGRAPEGSEHVPPGAVVVVISGEQVSRCHFVVRPGPDGAEVTDTNSLNGCFIDYPDRPGAGPQIPVGVPVPVEPGQQLRFGDRSLTVLAI